MTRKKRALLARIDGQLAAMERGGTSSARWRCVEQAFQALRRLSGDTVEHRHFEQLRRRLERLAGKYEGQLNRAVLAHWYTLARVECVVWQRYLRQGVAVAETRTKGPSPSYARSRSTAA